MSVKNEEREAQPPAAPPAAQEESEYLHGAKLWLVAVGNLLAIFLIALDQTIVTNALPRIVSKFNALNEETWVPTAFLLTQAPSLPIFAQLYTLFMTKWLFMITIFVFELGSLLSAVATSMDFLIAGRAVQGVGAAGLFIGAITMTSEVIALKDRPKFFGLFGGLFAIAGIAGPLLGGVFVDHVSWRWCFYINLPLSVPTIAFAFFFIPEKPSVKDRANPPEPLKPGQSIVSHTLKHAWTKLGKVDWIGAILTIGATVCLVLALTWGGNSKPWKSADVIATFVVSFVLFILFGLWEHRLGSKALIPLSLFKSRTQVGATLVSFMTRTQMFVAVYYFPLAYQAVKGVSATKAGLEMIPITLAVVLTSGIGGFVVSKTGRYWHIMVVGPIFGAVGFGLILLLTESKSYAFTVGIQILMGVGIGTTMQNSMMSIQADTPKELIPQATGIVTYAQFVGGSIALAIAGSIFATKLKSGLEKYAPDAPIETLLHSVEVLKTLSGEEKAQAIHAYMYALRLCMGPIGIAAAVVTIFGSIIIRNVSVRKEVQGKQARASTSKDSDSATVVPEDHASRREGGDTEQKEGDAEREEV